MADRARIIIVGAGISGLSAAEYLHNHRFKNVTILEAKLRPGGRMYTADFGHHGNEIIELGANWIHGAAATNSMIVLANQHNLLKDSVLLDRMEGYCYTPEGRAIDRDLQLQLWGMVCDWADEAFRRRDLSDPRPSWDANVRTRFAQNIHRFPEVAREDAQCVFNCLMNWVRFHLGGFAEDAFMEDAGVGYSDCPGGNVKVPAGMSAIIRTLCKQLPVGWLKLGQEVTRIEHGEDGVTVTCQDGASHVGDHVIVTLPLGFLKRHHSGIFYPPLGQRKSSAIRTIPFGKVDKIFLYWERPFWTPGTGSIKLAWTNATAEVKSRSEWYKRIFAFDEVLNNSHVLVAWISGNEAEVMETLPEEEVIETCARVLRQFLRNPSIPRADRMTRSEWCTDRFTLGSYSYASREMCERPGYIEALSEPVLHAGRPRVLFAGEATIPWAYSTMHGGRSSGLREGERLAILYNKIQKCSL